MSTGPIDAPARRSIAADLDRTLFVEAGAGSGKTTALVGRIVALVRSGRARLSEIAAITFTEAAASELRNRVREALEVEERSLRNAINPDLVALERCRAALEDADTAAISTLHSFAQRVLSEHPIAVGIPPRVEVLDEVQSQLEFERRWSRFLDVLLERNDLADLLLRALLLDIKFNSRHRGLRSVATVFNENWDRLDAMAQVTIDLPPLRWAPVLAGIEPLLRLRDECADPADKLALRIEQDVEPLARRIRDAATDDERLRLVKLWPAPKVGRSGQKGNWADVESARQRIDDANREVERFLSEAGDGVLRALASEVARFTLGAADERRTEGRLEFHDLLVLARRLLREDAAARRSLHERYRRLLLDEFQDTDPIQIELAALIASSTVGDGRAPAAWGDIAVDEGRLFFVGDPKQSIYRFRRASIETFSAAREAFGRGSPVTLRQNFRTVEPIVDFVNGLFGALIQEEPGRQPAYEPLVADRSAVQGIDQRPVVFGGPHPEGVRAQQLREAEAADVAGAISQIMDRRSRWLVHRGRRGDAAGPEWDLPKLSDIVILIPTRTSLGVLQEALEQAHIPYRADTGSLVFDSQEVRDLVSALRAIDDPADEISVVAALRSPLYGCGDDDLYRWRHDGGRWDYREAPPDAVGPDDPVRRGLDDLLERHRTRWWVEPSALVQSLIDDRRSMLLALGQLRPRDTWRRLRYLLDQARAFSEAGGGDLRSFLDWVALQGSDGARSHEPILAEPDDDSVRIMTVHASKGLEFPIVVVSGLTTAHRQQGGQAVLFDGEKAEIRLRSSLSTANFDRRADLEAEMDRHEKTRLLYVACTRARDHLLLSAHHKPGADSHGASVWSYAEAEMNGSCRAFEAPIVAPGPAPFEPTLPSLDDTPAARDQWLQARGRALEQASRPRVVSATAVARDRAGRLHLERDVEAEPEPAPLRRRGRAGTAIGRAVHAVLQTVDFAHPDNLLALADTQAHIEAVPWAAADIAATVEQALASPTVALAASARSWKELYLATRIGERVLEGYIDLLVETDAGLIVVDYKTDLVATEDEIDSAVERYRWQAAAYALAAGITTDRPVLDCVFVFCRPDGAIERTVPDLPRAVADLEASLTGR